MSHNYEAFAVKKLEMQPLAGNTYYIDMTVVGIVAYKLNERDLILLDCGLGYNDCDALIELFDSQGMNVKYILASHCHVDHIGGAEKLKARYGAKLYMPEQEADVCRSYEILKSHYPYLSLGMVTKSYKTMHCEPDFTYPPCDHTINIDGAEFEMIHTPGHSVANCCIVTPDDVLYMGDTVIGRAEMAHNKLVYTLIVAQDIESKKRLYGKKHIKYVAAHNGVYDEIDSLLDENIAYQIQTADNILELIDHPMSVENLVSAFHGRYGLRGSDILTCGLIESSIRSYLDYLWDTFRLGCVCEGGVVYYTRKI